MLKKTDCWTPAKSDPNVSSQGEGPDQKETD